MITASLVTVDSLAVARTDAKHWMAAYWAAWTLLWFFFFLIGVLKKRTWIKPVAWLAIVQSMCTAWVPGYLMLSGQLS